MEERSFVWMIFDTAIYYILHIMYYIIFYTNNATIDFTFLSINFVIYKINIYKIYIYEIDIYKKMYLFPIIL